MPGYPKLIKDVWGISGPIDAAFTRINCQGKTYIFKVCLRQVKYLRDSSPKNENSVINYLTSCHSKPVRTSFIFGTQIKIFLTSSKSLMLLSMEGQKSLGFHQKYLNLCSKDE